MNAKRNPGISSGWKIFFVILFAFLFYFYLSLPAESASHVVVCGDYAYLVDGRDGLRVVNITDLPANPQTNRESRLNSIGHVDTPGNAYQLYVKCKSEELEGSRTTVYIADGMGGLRIIDLTNPSGPQEIGYFGDLYDVRDVFVVDNTAYVIDIQKGLVLLDISNPQSPWQIGEWTKGDSLTRVAVQGRYAYVVNKNYQLWIVDVNKPASPKEVTYIPLSAPISDLEIKGSVAYLAVNNRGLVILNIDDPTQPAVISASNEVNTNLKWDAIGVNVVGSFAYMATGKTGLRILDIFNPEFPKEIGSNEALGEVLDVVALRDKLVIANKYDGLRVVTNELAVIPKQANTVIDQQINYEAVAIKGNTAFLAAGFNGLQILDLENRNIPKFVNNTILGSDVQATAIRVEGDYAFVAAGGKGVYLVYITDLKHIEVRSNIPLQDARGMDLKDSYLYVANGAEGVQVANLADPNQPVLGDNYLASGNGEAYSIITHNDLALVAYGSNGLVILDIKDRIHPKLIGSLPGVGDARGLFISGNYVYVAAGADGLSIVDISNPAAARIIASPLKLADKALSLVVKENRAYIAIWQKGIVVVDVVNPANPKQMTTLGLPGEARRVALDETLPYIYVADRLRGLRVINITNPAEPQVDGLFDVLLTSHAMHIVSIQDRKIAYILDGLGDLWVMDITNVQNPQIIGFVDVPGDGWGLQIVNQTVYIAAGSTGLVVVDVSDPVHPKVRGIKDTPGDAKDVWVDGNLIYIADGLSGLWVARLTNPDGINLLNTYPTGGYARSVIVRDGYAYINDDVKGLVIVNILDLLTITPAGTWNAGQSGFTSLKIVGNNAYIADPNSGLIIINIANRGKPEPVSSFLFGGVVSLAVNGNYVYLVDANRNGKVVDITIPSDIRLVGSFQIPSAVSEIEATSEYLYISGEGQGLWIGKIEQSNSIRGLSIYPTPGTTDYKQILLAVMDRLRGQPVNEKALGSGLRIAYDLLVLGILGLLVWLIFFAQFTLPLRSWQDRIYAVFNLILFGIGRSGPIVFVEDGKVQQRNEEKKRSSCGVIILDSASAGVLRSSTTFTRTIGPGVHFTRPGEYLADTVDLHNQLYPNPPIGPRQDDDPFEPIHIDPQKKGEFNTEYLNRKLEIEHIFQANQERRSETSGTTHDGIEVVPNIQVNFHLRNKLGSVKNWLKFEFDGVVENAVWLAITSQGILQSQYPTTKKLQNVVWNELPVLLTVDLWREYLRKFRFEELFDKTTRNKKELDQEKIFSRPGVEGFTGIEIIREMVLQRLTQAQVFELDDHGKLVKSNGNPNCKPSNEYLILLNRGIQVESVVIGSLRFPPQIEKKLVDSWFMSWLKREQVEYQKVEECRTETIYQGRYQAVKDFAMASASNVYNNQTSNPNIQAVLELLIQGTQKGILDDQEILAQLGSEQHYLNNLLQKVRRGSE